MTAALGEMKHQDKAIRFDPYHRWLGIPPDQQPPTHYRLLGLEPFESDEEVIRDAAQRQMLFVRTHQLSKYQDVCEQLLGEISQAKACLLHAEKRADYDAELRQSMLSANSGDLAAASEVVSPQPLQDNGIQASPKDFAAPSERLRAETQSVDDPTTQTLPTSPAADSVGKPPLPLPNTWWKIPAITVCILAMVVLANLAWESAEDSTGFVTTVQEITPSPKDEVKDDVESEQDSRATEHDKAPADGALAATGLSKYKGENLDSIIAPQDRLVNEAPYLQSITDSVGDEETYAKSLAAYIRVFPETNRSADFRQILDQEGSWRNVGIWNQVVATIKSESPYDISASQRGNLSAQIAILLSESSDLPLYTDLQVLAKVHAAEDRRNDNSVSEVISILTSKNLAELQVLESKKDRRRYYFYEAKRSPASTIFQVMMTEPDKEKKPEAMQLSRIALRNYIEARSAESRMAEKVAQLNPNQDWIEFYVSLMELIRSMRDQHPRMDLIHQFQLIGELQTRAEEGSHFLAAALKDHLWQGGLPPLEPSLWIHPKRSEQAEQVRGRLRQIQLPPYERAAKLAKGRKMGFLARLRSNRPIKWVGWLRRDTSGKWVVEENREHRPTDSDQPSYVQTRSTKLVRFVEFGEGSEDFVEGQRVHQVDS